MDKTMNIATWNLCLGIANKKDTVTAYLSTNNIQVCCLQETEILPGFPENILNCGGLNHVLTPKKLSRLQALRECSIDGDIC